jgi:hypothetical protein
MLDPALIEELAMTDHSPRFAARLGFALAVVVVAAVGVPTLATAATPQQTNASPRVTDTTVFTAALQPSRAIKRTDFDGIDPSVRHRWPDLADTSTVAPAVRHN